MRPIRKILVAVKNPDAKSFPAIDKANQIARTFKASIELYHAISEPIYADFELTDTSLTGLRRHRVDLHLGRLQTIATHYSDAGLRIASHVDWDYPVHEAIVRRAAATRADLIVAECHAGRRLAPWLLHLTDWELLRTSSVPVLVVKTKELYSKPIVLAAVDPSHVHAKPAKLDDEILKSASGISRHLSGSLHAMHAYFPVPLDVPASETLTDTETAIPRVANEIGADLVVMGAVSRSGLRRIFIGNTAERVLGSLRCDVLVVKPKRFAARVARKTRGVRLVAPQLPSVF